MKRTARHDHNHNAKRRMDAAHMHTQQQQQQQQQHATLSLNGDDDDAAGFTTTNPSVYGVADVFMKTLKDRIKAVIKIAHPDFRKELMEKICTTPLIKEDDFEGYDPFN